MSSVSRLYTAISPFPSRRVVATTFVRHVEYYDELGSTNDQALQLVAAGEAAYPLLLVADRQHSGRGRGQNRWWSAPGALTFSLAVDGNATNLPAWTWPRISLSSGLAVCEAVLELLPGYDVRLKWPNDVYLESRKVCGILVETSPARPGAVVIGVGVNVNNSLADAPEEVRATGTSLVDVAGRCFDRWPLLIRILQELAQHLDQLETGTLELSDCWRRLCMLHGRTLCVESGGRRLIGVCQGIDDAGALLLQTEGGLERCFAGVVARVL
jgi:BirA family biotin operon repressor/biotin-[acetyl-CoA-carboxylase] ligase